MCTNKQRRVVVESSIYRNERLCLSHIGIYFAETWFRVDYLEYPMSPLLTLADLNSNILKVEHVCRSRSNEAANVL